MDGLQEQICAGCEFYEDNYKKALERFLLYKEKIMCTQTLIQKYERRKQHNQQLLRKLQKSRQNVAAVRERFMHYMERYMPLEKSYNDLRAAHNDLEEEMRTQSTTVIALQQHNKQLSALIEVQEKGVSEYKAKSDKLEEELKRSLRSKHISKVKANDKYRNMLKAAVELAVILKDKGMLPDSYKLCLKTWRKQLMQDLKLENICDNGGLSPDKASSISSQDTGFDSSKSMSDDEHPFDENVIRRKGAAGDKRCNNISKSTTPSIPLETSISDKSVNTSDVRNFRTSRATQSFQNLRDIGVNTSVSMLTSDLSELLHEVTVNECKNYVQSPSDQGLEDHDFESLPFGKDLQLIDHNCSYRGSIFSPVKGAVHPASAEMPSTSVEMPPSNDCVEEYQSKFVQSEKLVFTNADSSKTIPPHLKDTCTAGKSLSVLFASEVPVFRKGQSVLEQIKEEEERRGGVGGGREEGEELGEEEEVGLGLGGGGGGGGEEEEDEYYDDGYNDGANDISSPDHDKGRNLHTGREDVHNEWNCRMQTALCFKVPFREAHTTESRVSHILQEMKLFAPRLVSPLSPCSDEVPTKNAAVSTSSEVCSTDLRTNVLSSVECDSLQVDLEVSQTGSNNNLVFQQQPIQAVNRKERIIKLLGKTSSTQKNSISNKTQDQCIEGTNPDCKIEPLKRVCQKECSSKYSSVLARFSVGKDVSSKHHKTEMAKSRNVLPDTKYSNVITPDFVKSLNHLTSIIRSKKFLKYSKKKNLQRSCKLKKSILKKVNSPKKHFAANKPSSSYSNIVETASGCFLEIVNDTPSSVCNVESSPKTGKFEERLTFPETVNDTQISVCNVESSPKTGKFEERLTFPETVDYPHEEPNSSMAFSDRKTKILPSSHNTDVLALKKQKKEGRSHLRLMVPEEVEKSQRISDKNISQHETHALIHVRQKQVEHKESLRSGSLAHDFESEVDNHSVKSLEKVHVRQKQVEHKESLMSGSLALDFESEVDNHSVKSLEKDEKDPKNVVMTLNSKYNCEGTVNNLECSSVIPDTCISSTNNNQAELKRRDTDTTSCVGFIELLDDLSVSDDNSNPESTNGNSGLSHRVEAEGSNDECDSDSEVACNNFSKADVPQNCINSGAKYEYLKKNHDGIGSEESYDEQCNSESIEVSKHSRVRYFVPQIVNGNESEVKYEEVETNIPIECSQEICVENQSVDLLDDKCSRKYEVQNINLISEAGESVSEISPLSTSHNTDGRTTNNVEVPFSHLNSVSDASTSEVTKGNEKELEMNPVSTCNKAADSLAEPDITTDCTSEPSRSTSTEDCATDCSDHSTNILIQGSEVATDKYATKQDSFSPNDCVSKKIASADFSRDVCNTDSVFSKDFTGIRKCPNEIKNQCESHMAVKGHKHTEEKHGSDNSADICEDVSSIEVLTVKSGLQEGAVKDVISDHNKNCNIDINEKSKKELEEEITHQDSLLKEDVLTQKCERRTVVGNSNIQKSLIIGSGSEEPIIKEHQETNKDEIPEEKIPQAELITEQEGKDTAEAFCEEYYIPQRTKKRIAHRPKPEAAGSESCSEDNNFKSPIKAVRKQTPRKTKVTEDEQRNIKSVKQNTQNSASKQLGHIPNEIGSGLQSLPLDVITDKMKEKSSLEAISFNSEATKNVNCVSERKKLKIETELGIDALLNAAKNRQLKMTRHSVKQLEPPSINLQAARRSARLKKSETPTLLQKHLDVHANKGRKKLKDGKYSADESLQEVVSIKTENCDDGSPSSDMAHIKKEKCSINEALLAGEPVTNVQNSKLEKLHKLEGHTNDEAVGPLTGGSKRKIKSETGGESNRKKLAPYLFKKPSCYQTEVRNEAIFPVPSSSSEDAPHTSCKSEVQSSCLVPSLTDKKKCKEECADSNVAISVSQQHNECGSVTSSESGTSLEENRGNSNETRLSNGECVDVHNDCESDIKLDGVSVSYAKGDIIRKCLAIQKRSKLAARRPTRKILDEQQVFVSHHLYELLEGDFTSDVLNTALEQFVQDDIPVDAVALVRCVLKTLIQEDCNEIDRSHDIRAPPLSVTEEKLITLMITLRNRCSRFSTLINDFLSAVEYYILNFRTTPEYDALHILTRFHTALCKAEGLRERAQALCYDALYCLKRKCFPIIYTILTYYPEVFPKSSTGMSSPVCVSIVHSIFTSMNEANKTYLRIKPLITLLCRMYDYKLEEVLSCDLVDCFIKHLKCQTPKSGEVCAAVTLLAKRKDNRAWTLTHLIPKYLAPIIQEWRLGKINEAVISDVIDLIGCLIKPFTEQCDLGPVLKIFIGILHAERVTQTLKMKAALNLARQASQHFSEVAPSLYEWVPEGQLPIEFWQQMSDILSVKPYTFWMSFLSTCGENSEEMCVGSVNS